MNLVLIPSEAWMKWHKLAWIVAIKNFFIVLPSQPFLGHHLGFHNFFHAVFFFAWAAPFFKAWLFLCRFYNLYKSVFIIFHTQLNFTHSIYPVMCTYTVKLYFDGHLSKIVTAILRWRNWKGKHLVRFHCSINISISIMWYH